MKKRHRTREEWDQIKLDIKAKKEQDKIEKSKLSFWNKLFRRDKHTTNTEKGTRNNKEKAD